VGCIGCHRRNSATRPCPRTTNERLIALAISGCASSRGFDRGLLDSQLQSANPQVSDRDIAAALDRKPQLPPRFRLGVIVRDSTAAHDASPRRASEPWRWTIEEKNKLLESLATLKTLGVAGDVFPIIEVEGRPGADLKALRLAAARYGADAVLIVTGAVDLDRQTSPLAFTYLAIVPMFLVPATREEALFVSRAALWDVRNEFLYMTAESESVQGQRRPLVFIDSKEVVDDARKDSLRLLIQEVSKRMSSLAAGQSAAGG
jgi:hypothetical protein